MNADQWNARYLEGRELPWDTGRPDRHLIEWIEAGGFEPTSTLELGCGTGTNARWLARRGFDVTGVDISERAVELARARSGDGEGSARFQAADVLTLRLAPQSFGLVFDRGCFHSFEPIARRIQFVQTVALHLKPNGVWFSIMGSTDGPDRDVGPPRRSACEVAEVVEPWFEILSLKAGFFDSSREPAPRCWLCAARKRILG